MKLENAAAVCIIGSFYMKFDQERFKFIVYKSISDMDDNNKLIGNTDDHGINERSESDHQKKKKKKKLKKLHGMLSNNKTGQMMFKTAIRNHLDLSSLADRKASTMLSINSLIITFALPYMYSNIPENSNLIIPVIMLLTTCLASITFATLVTRPQKMEGITNMKTINEGKGDLFFFGNFFNMSFDDYLVGMELTLRNIATLEKSIVLDLFMSGKVLGGKYKKLRICYLVFIIGLIATAITFLIMASLIDKI